MNDPVMQSSSPTDTPPSNSRSAILYLVIALGLALVIRFYIAAPYIVIGSSMEPNFHDYNYLIIDRLSYAFDAPERGDVIVLDMPENTSRALIKRIIGIPGDTVVLSGSNPSVQIINTEHPNGITLSEPYLDPANYGGRSDMSVTLGDDQYFVLGDNRKVSSDSRIWGILPKSDIVGRVFLRLYPFSNLSLLPAQARYQ